MAYLAAITAAGGVPLFIRTKGNLPPLSFPIVGSLNGVHLYASNMKTSLLSCLNGGAKVVWKCFYESITLILVTSAVTMTDTLLHCLLDLVFNGMVLLLGLHELENVTNVERLKKDLKCCYPLIDHLLQGTNMMSPLTQTVDIIALKDASILATSVEAFAEASQSNYGCLSVHGRICVATESWWKLSTLELTLISLLLSSLPPAACHDIPIYLPKASSKVAHRLLVFTLLEGVQFCVLCGPDPPLKTVQALIGDYWSGLVDALKTCAHTFPRCVPMSLNLDPSILAFCLVNLDSRRSVTSLKPSMTADTHRSRTALSAGFQGEMDPLKRFTYLSKFYTTVVDNLFPLDGRQQEQVEVPPPTSPPTSTLHETLPHKIAETYICTKHYKAYAIHKEQYNLFVLFGTTTPTFALKKTTSDLFLLLTREAVV